MSDTIQLDYDATAKRAVLTFPNRRTLAISNVTKEQAERFHARHAEEFMKRDCCLQTVIGTFTREGQ